MRLLQTGIRCAAYCLLAFACALGSYAQDTKPQTSEDPNAADRQSAGIVDVSPQSFAASPELPDSPGTEWAKAQSAATPGDNAAQQGTPAPQPATQPDQKPQRPVGAAAAEAPKVSGITAAEPAGVAIAPAKQRRVRTIVIRVGAILAAGAAVGTVVALSEGTSSKPPGAH